MRQLFIQKNNTMETEKVDALVIGGGPAGTVAAAIINKAGFKTKIVEKERFPRFVIGESLLPRCMEAFEEAGFLDALSKQGYQKKFGAKFTNSKREVMDFNFSNQFSEGWSWTWQVPRAHFDNVLLQETERMGVQVEQETEVVSINFDKGKSCTRVQLADKTQKEIEARFIVDASGYGRVIPRLFNLDRPSGLPVRKTLFTHIRDERRSRYSDPERILIVDHKPGVWIWCIPFSTGVTSCGFVAPPEFFDGFSGSDEDKLRALIASEWSIAERFENAEFLFPPRIIQGWSVTTDKFYGDGFVLTGNVTEFLDPVFSSGVTLAAASSQRAAKLAVRQLSGEIIDWEKEYMQPVMSGVDVFRTYVNAWYNGDLQKLFFEEKKVDLIVSQICSVLAGYVWDTSNPFVKEHEKSVRKVVQLVELSKKLQ
jgi:flavin-dependent dehydrogenase